MCRCSQVPMLVCQSQFNRLVLFLAARFYTTLFLDLDAPNFYAFNCYLESSEAALWPLSILFSCLFLSFVPTSAFVTSNTDKTRIWNLKSDSSANGRVHAVFLESSLYPSLSLSFSLHLFLALFFSLPLLLASIYFI